MINEKILLVDQHLKQAFNHRVVSDEAAARALQTEAVLALAVQFDRIATVLEEQTKHGGALDFRKVGIR